MTRAKPNALAILNKAKTLFKRIGKKQIPESIKEVVKPFNYSKEALKDFEVEYDLDLVNSEFQAWLAKQDFSGGEKGYKFIDENGEVYQSVTMAAPDKPETRSHRPLIHPITNKPCPVPAKGWRNPDETMDKILEANLVIFGKDETTQPRKKYLLKENLFEVTPSIYSNGSSDEKLMSDLQLNFPYPKVTSASKYLIQNIHPNPKIILDFFAGSGTSLHATMNLNQEDGGNRQCILVTNNENNIAEEVCYERNKRVVKGYNNAKGEQVPGLSHNNLRYYKTEFISRDRSLQNKRKLTRLATELLCIKEDCYNEQSGAMGKADWFRLFSNEKEKYLLVIYDDNYIEEAVDKLQKFIEDKQPKEQIRVYVFSNGQYPYTEEFEDVLENVVLCALPDAIYKAYQHVLPKTEKMELPKLQEETPDEIDEKDAQIELFD
jgi:adenine-specific DNA-methyltransferase